LRVEKNRGQAEPSVQFIGRGDGFLIGFSEKEVLFSGIGGIRLALAFPGEATTERWETLDPLTSTSSYFIGSVPAAWMWDVSHFRRLIRRGIYPGTDVICYASGNRLEYDFQLSPVPIRA
jgi:hypothetical protein